jgi:hypothetical protein
MKSSGKVLLLLVGTALAALACGAPADQADQADQAAEYAEDAADATPVDEFERYRAVVVPEGVRWLEAKERAEAAGGHLVTIGSAEENEQVHALIADNPDIWINLEFTAVIDGEEGAIQVTSGPWIGLHQPVGSPEPDGGWAWVTGEAVEYTNWSMGEFEEPNDLGGVEHYGQFFGQGLDSRAAGWNDASSDPSHDLVAVGVEIVGELHNPRGYIVEFEQ